ncbi:uncharacterized protein LOC118999904 [Sturnira hondurensis]|uniref:uncharacterized protein LOC118999904 n=1 Tax=Sturnira hondurensis TaxID=192404 RepID=UPI00187A3CBD|nr:uncharacterized protein LOC118999904 [Sturnira hondurensis]
MPQRGRNVKTTPSGSELIPPSSRRLSCKIQGSLHPGPFQEFSPAPLAATPFEKINQGEAAREEAERRGEDSNGPPDREGQLGLKRFRHSWPVLPRPQLGSVLPRRSNNSGDAEAGRGAAALSAVLAGAVSAEAERGRHRARESRAHRLQPSPLPRPRPRPPGPPAWRDGGRRAERFQMWSGGAQEPGTRIHIVQLLNEEASLSLIPG